MSVLALLVASNTALAQSQQQATTPAKVVEAETELEEIVVTATRNPAQKLDVPANVTVISRKKMDDHGTRDIQDLVRYEPGVSVERTTSGTDPWHNLSGFTVRGVSGNRVQMQVDGARVQERITDGTRDLVDLPFMKAIEIMRGPGSVLWGADALGGIVSFTTLDPDDLLRGKDKPWAARVSTGYDSFDNSFTKTGMLAYQISPSLQSLLMVNNRSFNEPELSTARADGGIWGCPATRYLACDELDPVHGNKWNGLGKLVFKPDLDHEWKLTVESFFSDSTVRQLYDYGLVSSGYLNGDYIRNQELERQNISLQHSWIVDNTFVDALKWHVSYSPQARRLDSDRWQTSTSTGQVRHTNAVLDYEEKFLQADLQLNSSFALGATHHALTYGFQADHTRTDYERIDTVTNLTTGVTTVTEGGGFNFANATTMRGDLYLQDEVKLFGDRVTITPGVRWANYKIDPRPADSYVEDPDAPAEKISSSKLIPQIGAVVKFDDTYSAYARYAEGFKMPTAQQLYMSLPGTSFNLVPNPDLRPESVRSYELGLRGKYERGWFSLGVFHADYTDFILSLQNVPNTVDYMSINLSSVKLWGVEASGEYQIHRDLIANASASYQYGRQKATPTSDETYFDAASPFRGTLGMRWYLRDWNIDTEFLATAGSAITKASADTVYKPDGYTVLDTFVNWKPQSNIAFRAGVMNILDKRYFQNLNGGYATTATESVARSNPLELQVAAGRTFKVSLTVDF